MKRVAVLGGGNGGHAMAAHIALTLKGCDVRLVEAPECQKGFLTTLERQGTTLVDVRGEERFASFEATTDFKKGMEGVEYVMLVAPATWHDHFFEAMIPFLEDGQVVFIWTGNYGVLRLANILRGRKFKKKVLLAESHTLPWGCRIDTPGRVTMLVETFKILAAALPAAKSQEVVDDLKNVWPLENGGNVLTTSLNNLNPIVHPVGSILNAGWIDAIGKDFHFYSHGTTLSIAYGIKAVYEEVRKVAQTVGVQMVEYPEKAFFSKSTIMSHFGMAPFDTEGMAARIAGPSSVKGRYISEDIPYGLVPVALLARQFGLATPVIDAVINLGATVNQADYWKGGRSLEQLGIAGLSREDLNILLRREVGEDQPLVCGAIAR
jgi:opine dehydrogenase